MEIKIHKETNVPLAEIISNDIVINELGDALDLIGNCDYQGARSIIVKKEHIIPDFFDLKTGLAGEILQKFSTYDVRLAIIGNFQHITSKSLHDFIYESNKIGRVIFTGTLDEIIVKLSKRGSILKPVD